MNFFFFCFITESCFCRFSLVKRTNKMRQTTVNSYVPTNFCQFFQIIISIKTKPVPGDLINKESPVKIYIYLCTFNIAYTY